MAKGIIYLLLYAIVVPGGLLIWGRAVDDALEGTYLAKRIQMCLWFDLPQWIFLLLGVLALASIIRAAVELNRGSHRCDALLYAGFPFYMLCWFFYLRMSCSIVFGIPLICLGSAAIWMVCRRKDRPPLLPLPPDGKVPPALRFGVLVLLLAIFFAAGLLFQEAYLLWALFPGALALALVPLLGFLLPKPEQLREYVSSSFYALLLCGMIYLAGQFYGENMVLMDFGIIAAYLFLELQLALLIRALVPPRRNFSLVILGLSAVVSWRIVLPLCNPWIVTLSMYILYLLIDNRKAIHKKLLSRSHFHHAEVHMLSWEDYAGQAWGFGALLAAYLAGPDRLFQVLAGLGAVLAGALLHSRLESNPDGDHVVLRNFPHTAEVSALLITGIVGWDTREELMIMLSAFAAASCLMRMIWSVGGLIGRRGWEHPYLQEFRIISNAGICFLLTVLFFVQAPASVLLGSFLTLRGIARIWEFAYHDRRQPGIGLTSGWVLILIGLFVFVSSPAARLPVPEWSPLDAVCAVLACAAFYVWRLFDFYFRRRRNMDHEKYK
ncbi:MAG: hypothetical protein J5806_04030 [Lentisphaeria bacterium]|nr:hypothetical protein [Lentisphaeria bacterium]